MGKKEKGMGEDLSILTQDPANIRGTMNLKRFIHATRSNWLIKFFLSLCVKIKQENQKTRTGRETRL